jgi:protocatechuate 3,4-dioxygenase beta subunit
VRKILVLLVGISAAAQPPAPETAKSGIFGRVMDVEAKTPVRRVQVKVYNRKGQWDELTDADGQFRFPTLDPGDYFMIVHRDGYTDRAYKVDRGDFEKQIELPVELHKQGVVTGKVTDNFGLPLESARIEAFSSRNPGGKPEFVSSAETNDLGEYRLAGLNPGQYQIRASYQDGARDEFDSTPIVSAATWFGDPEKPSLLTIQVATVIDRFDFTLSPRTALMVRGTVHNQDGSPAETASMWIVNESDQRGQNGTLQDGEFEFHDIGPGTYTVSAEILNAMPPQYGSAVVQVTPTGAGAVDIVLKPVPQLEGELQMASGAPVPSGTIYFNAVSGPAIQHSRSATFGADGKFSVALVPGEYSIAFDRSVGEINVPFARFDGAPMRSWRIRIEEGKTTIRLFMRAEPGVKK